VLRRDRAQGVAQGEVPLEPRGLELGGAPPPVVGGEGGRPGGGEGVGEQPRLHRAVDDHPGAVAGAPGDLRAPRVAPDHREGGLERGDVSEPLAPLEQRRVVVRDARPAHLALLHQPQHLAPRVLDRGAGLVRPVELVEVDRLDAEPPQRRLALLPHPGGTRVPDGKSHGIGVVPAQAALGEHERALGGGDAGEGPAHDLLGVPEAVDGRGVDPAHAPRHRVADGGDRVGVVLRTPGEGPAAPARGPRTEADRRDLRPRRSEPARGKKRPHRGTSVRAKSTAGRGSPRGGPGPARGLQPSSPSGLDRRSAGETRSPGRRGARGRAPVRPAG
jgi:hypothetical protein